MKKIFRVFFLILSICTMFTVAACGESEQEEHAVRYEVSFETFGGTMYYNIRANEGDTITLPTPEKEGYEFDGWWNNSNYEGQELENIYSVTADAVLYAKWTAYSGVITFISNGGTEYNDLSFSAQKVNLPTPEREGYVFAGWYDNPEFTGDSLKATFLPTASMSVYAKWDAIIGSIIFESNGGTQYQKVNTTGQKVALPTPVKEDFEFAGWYDNPEFTGKVYEGEYLPNGTLVLYARWASEFKVISFDTNGGESLKDLKLFDNDALELPTPFRYGYSFKGWYLDESFQGEPVNDYFYRPTEDIKLYAKWEECTYVYFFYGDNKMDWVKYEFSEGDVITVEDLETLFVPEDLTVTDYLGFKHDISFKNWAHQGYDETSHIDVTEDIVVGKDFIILVAVYDDSNVPEKEYLTLNHETGVYTTTGKTAHVFIEESANVPYAYSLDISFKKGVGGAVGPAFRMYVPETDYHYEAGCEYLCPGIGPDTGSMQLSSVLNGDWSKLAGLSLANLPQSWQNKYNGADENALIEFTMTVVDYGTWFEVYIDNDLAYTYTNTEQLAKYPFKGLGVRSSTTPSNLSNARVHYGYDVSFNTGVEGMEVSPQTWYAGNIELPKLTREDYSLVGWYYDAEFTRQVDDENFMINEDAVLYAKWSNEFYVVSFEENGGSECANINWLSGKITLPTPTKMNHIFIGWYYDEELTNPVDNYSFEVASDVTLYAAWRLPYSKLTDNGDGSYIYTGSNTAAVLGLVENPLPLAGTYNEYSQVIAMPKGSGSVGIAFRMNITADYQYEAGANYLSVQFTGTGALRISKVTEGDWTRLIGDRGLTSLCQSWQDKFNGTADGGQITVKLTVRDYGTYFEVYIDDVLTYTYGQAGEATDLTIYTGNGYGVRSSGSNSIVYSDITAKAVVIE